MRAIEALAHWRRNYRHQGGEPTLGPTNGGCRRNLPFPSGLANDGFVPEASKTVHEQPRQTKASVVEALLTREGGASLEALCEATGWQAHTCRAFLTGLRKRGKQVIRASDKHREFAFASGEMSETEFTRFLTDTLGNAASVMRDGAIAFVCMDWRHMGELLSAGRQVFTELKNLVVWNKTNGGMGAFYRSKHELIFVFKHGTAPHTNTFGLGESGRYRTNVWDHAGISSIGGKRDEELAMHPTVKPVALVADAIRDCSRRGELILDCFAGSGRLRKNRQSATRRGSRFC